MDENTKAKFGQILEPKYLLAVLGILAITSIIVISILRDRLVDSSENQVSVIGQGKVSYQPDTATVTLGVQVDRAPTADAALEQLNEKIANVMVSFERLGIKKEDIKTQTYVLTPQYDYKDNVTTVAGYSANQKLAIKVSNIIENKDAVSQVVASAGSDAANQVMGIEFTVSNMNDLKQQAKILAIADARLKSDGLAKAAGIKLGKVENWYENEVSSPEYPMANRSFLSADASSEKTAPQVPPGIQEIIVEVGLNYEVK